MSQATLHEWKQHQARLASNRERFQGRSPYDVAVEQIEHESGQSRDHWEHSLTHPLVLRANQLARALTGLPEESHVR